MKSVLQFLQFIAAVTLVTAHNLLRLSGLQTLPMRLAFDQEDEIDRKLLESLGKLEKRIGKVDSLEKDIENNTQLTAKIQAELLEVRKNQLERRAHAPGGAHSPRGAHEVSDECARFLGGLVLAAGLRQEKLGTALAARAEVEIRNLMGVNAKAALTSSDIPLPTVYARDVVALVYEFGMARKLGTVFPLGAGVVKLPRLKTDPAFGLLAQSTAVTEVSPQVEFVTFTSEKFGGLIRLPSEIDEDSIVEMGNFVANYAARQIAAAEDWNFFRSTGAGSGINGTAKGLTRLVVDESIVVNQASTKTRQSDMTVQNLRDLRSTSGIHGAVLAHAMYICHPTYEAAFASFNTAGDKPYQRSMGTQGATFDGYPIVWVPSMPAYSTSPSASTPHLLFGDPSFHYLGTRGAIRFDSSREAAFTTDEILIRAIERFTTGKMALACVAGLVTAAS